jgi:hypothetical protein
MCTVQFSLKPFSKPLHEDRYAFVLLKANVWVCLRGESPARQAHNKPVGNLKGYHPSGQGPYTPPTQRSLTKKIVVALTIRKCQRLYIDDTNGFPYLVTVRAPNVAVTEAITAETLQNSYAMCTYIF